MTEFIHTQNSFAAGEIAPEFYLTKNNPSCCRSCLEIARTAGWDETTDVDIKVKTALLALEQAKYIRREENVPKKI